MARPPTPISPTQLEIARRRSKAGVPMRDVAKDLGLNRRTLERRLADYRPPDDEEDVSAADIDFDEDTERQAVEALANFAFGDSLTHEQMKALASKAAVEELRLADQLRAQGELDVARKHRREGINAINALRALEKQRPSNEIIVTKEQLAEAERQALELFDRYASTRPQSCAHCNRALSIEWATKGETK